MKRLILAALLLGLFAAPARAESKVVDYEHDGVKLKGYLAWDETVKGKRPGVLVVHEWWGLNDYARKRADQLAKMGYVAFAVDMYGDGKSSEHPEEAQKMMEACKKNRDTWLGRANAGLEVLRKNENVDPKRLAAIGYCFGGSTVLELAYTGADVKAVASFHGGLTVPESTKDVKAHVLIATGGSDAFIPKEQVEKVRARLEEGKVHYKIEVYPGAVHSFTVPGADKHGNKNMAYDKDADEKSWAAMKAMFDEVFGTK
jgi:dienelactone hydrolase